MNEDEARQRISETIRSALGRVQEAPGITSEGQIEEAVDQLLPIWQTPVEVAKPPGGIHAFLPFNYVIPDQDLKLLDTTFSVVAAAATIGYLVPALGFDPIKGVAAALTAAVIAILRLLHNLKLAVPLEDLDHAIVSLLACVPEEGLTSQAAHKALSLSLPELTVEEVERRLNSLAACPTASGAKTALVWKDNDERWHPNGL
jgi:hypothetical protein